MILPGTGNRARCIRAGLPGAGDRDAFFVQPQLDTPDGAARLISLRHPWRRSNRRPLAGRPCPASLPTTPTAPPGCLAAGDGGRPSVVAGWRDRDVRVSRRRSARSQGRRRAVKQGCSSVARGGHRAVTPLNGVPVMLRFAFCRLFLCAIVRRTLRGGPRSGPETCQTGTL